MLHAFATLVIAVDDHEPSKTPFYIFGGILAAWAVVVSFLGLRSETFPGSESGARAVYAISIVLVLAALTSALLTS